MGKAYIDHPFAATIASTVAHFPETTFLRA